MFLSNAIYSTSLTVTLIPKVEMNSFSLARFRSTPQPPVVGFVFLALLFVLFAVRKSTFLLLFISNRDIDNKFSYPLSQNTKFPRYFHLESRKLICTQTDRELQSEEKFFVCAKFLPTIFWWSTQATVADWLIAK